MFKTKIQLLLIKIWWVGKLNKKTLMKISMLLKLTIWIINDAKWALNNQNIIEMKLKGKMYRN